MTRLGGEFETRKAEKEKIYHQATKVTKNSPRNTLQKDPRWPLALLVSWC